MKNSVPIRLAIFKCSINHMWLVATVLYSTQGISITERSFSIFLDKDRKAGEYSVLMRGVEKHILSQSGGGNKNATNFSNLHLERAISI